MSLIRRRNLKLNPPRWVADGILPEATTTDTDKEVGRVVKVWSGARGGSGGMGDPENGERSCLLRFEVFRFEMPEIEVPALAGTVEVSGYVTKGARGEGGPARPAYLDSASRTLSASSQLSDESSLQTVHRGQWSAAATPSFCNGRPIIDRHALDVTGDGARGAGVGGRARHGGCAGG